jgi:hypothetical protein
MAPVGRTPRKSDPPAQVCVRCSKPITPGTASQLAGRAVHLRCLAQVTKLDAVEPQDGSGLELMRAHAAAVRAEEIMDMIRRFQTTCPVCGEPLGTSRGVLFQGDQLVHAVCWRADPQPFDAHRGPRPHRAPQDRS